LRQHQGQFVARIEQRGKRALGEFRRAGEY
jgi:hypothetical protein